MRFDRRRFRPPKAFTLIELLIVVAIIAILAAIAVPNFLEAQIRSKVTRVKADLRSLATAMEAYGCDFSGKYPPDFDSGMFGPVPPSEYKTFACLTTPVAYITSIPEDCLQFQRSISIGDFLQQQDKEKCYFAYAGWDGCVETRGRNDPICRAWAEVGQKWQMVSVGPDQYYQGLGWDPTNWVDSAYDATNGTRSGGDIARTNVRFFP